MADSIAMQNALYTVTGNRAPNVAKSLVTDLVAKSLLATRVYSSNSNAPKAPKKSGRSAKPIAWNIE